MNPKQGSSVDEFFSNLPKGDKKDAADVFGDGNKPADHSPEKDEATGEGDEPRKNRRHRRLEQQLQAEREANIALNERLKMKTESEKFAAENSGEIDPRITRIFEPNELGKQNAAALNEMIKEQAKAAKDEAVREFEDRQKQAAQEEREYETFIDNELENLEDEHGVDLTSDAPAARKARREFLELVQNLSPKDEEGNVTGFADFESTFDVYQKTKSEPKPDNSSNDRRKEMSSNSMQRAGGGSNGIPPKTTPGFRGWMKDFNVRPQ